MKTRYLFILVIILLPTCKKDNEFDTGLIPGTYTGAIHYFPSVDGGEPGFNDPDLSKSGDYKTTITKYGSNFVLSFDTSFIYSIPDINVKISSFSSEIVSIYTPQGQAYSSSGALENYPGQPANYISIDTYIHRVDCHLTLKSNDPDSIYYLNFVLLRIY
jgi:hypothetical protein